VEKTLQEMNIVELYALLSEIAQDLRDIALELEEREAMPVPDHERSPKQRGRSAHG